MSDVTYQKFVRRWEEVTDLPIQQVGPFTPYYKRLVSRLKVMPWPMLVVTSILLVLALYLFLTRSTITLLVSILQRGF
ncbi:hypothetical protein A2Z00_01245 [Candidatus Gottesmanbacteria bacterium RBG_13_45_10]|uniref:Uncharacterized protein n=1 Tax=Candidatus Gottesmanbacteria bacterium RBG_13_45_10 TaxID=1798370 RepID=A0A1F5ZG18_9BACT|nr:MAG: hypothetical protein A2Z00_01245 [Candidatus Gottesmanbacteria bacterium RBG_13_45_10]